MKKQEMKDQDSKLQLLTRPDDFPLICNDLQLQINANDQANDKNQIKKILQEILGYPSSELAVLHQNANRIGTHDLEQKAKVVQLDKNNITNLQKLQYCPCCGLKRQIQYINLKTSFNQILNLGQSTLLFFNCFRQYFILMLLLSLIYSIYNLATNVIASSRACQSILGICDTLTIALGGKQLDTTYIAQNNTFYMIQSWIGIGLVIIWGIYFFYMNYEQRKIDIDSDSGNRTASDFSILIEKMPKDINKQKFEEIMKQYYKNVESIVRSYQPQPKKGQKQIDFFKVVSYNVAKPYFLNEQKLKDKQIQELAVQFSQKSDQFRKWITQRISQKSHQFKISKQQREKKYKQLQQLKKKMMQKQKQIADKFLQQKKKNNQQTQIDTNTVFVTYRYSQARAIINKLNKQNFTDRLRDCFTSLAHNNRMPIPGIIITRAPQPQDIYWSNIGVPLGTLYKRKLATFTVTILMLCASFGAIYGLSVLQVQKQNDQVISFIISIVITLINVIIAQVILYLNAYQMNFTKTNYQRSLAVKTILAQLVNTIVVTFLADYYVKNNIYKKGGLADDVFYIGLSNAILTPILKFIDVGYFLGRLMIKFYDRPVKKLYLNQLALNRIYIGLEFQVGFQYVYLVKTCIFTAFFVSLQPILSFMALLGILLMYWAQKYVLLKRACRPAPGSDIINSAMSQIIYMCPIIFALGNLTWPKFLPGGSPAEALVPNIISLGIAVFFFIFPLDVICGCLIPKSTESLVYQESRIFLTTQYDRLNPETSKQGYQNYMKFIQQLKSKPIDTSDQKGKQLQQQLNKVLTNGLPPPRQQQMGQINPFMQSFLPMPPMMQPSYGMMNPYGGYNPYAMQMQNMQYGRSPYGMGMPYGGMQYGMMQNPMISGFGMQPRQYMQPQYNNRPTIMQQNPVVNVPIPVFPPPQPIIHQPIIQQPIIQQPIIQSPIQNFGGMNNQNMVNLQKNNQPINQPQLNPPVQSIGFNPGFNVQIPQMSIHPNNIQGFNQPTYQIPNTNMNYNNVPGFNMPQQQGNRNSGNQNQFGMNGNNMGNRMNNQGYGFNNNNF